MTTMIAADLLLPSRNNYSRNKMQEREMKYILKNRNSQARSHIPWSTDPLAENSRNPVKKQEKSLSKPYQIH